MANYVLHHSSEREEAINLLGWANTDPLAGSTLPRLEEILEGFEREKEFSRAAAISVFHFDFIRAHKSLSLSQNDNESSFIKSILSLLKDWQSNYGSELSSIFSTELTRKKEEIKLE
jgi:hypothetical protein